MEKQQQPPSLARVPAGTPTETPDGRTFIGGKSKEFQQGREQLTQTSVPQQKESQQKQDEAKNQNASPCTICGGDVTDKYVFCPTCGTELNRKALAKALRIELTEEDLSEYLFKGYLVKEIPLVGDKKALFKTLLPSEAEEVDNALLSKFGDKSVTNSLYSNVYSTHILSYGWIKFDDNSLGETPEQRLKHIREHTGGHLVDIASKKWNMFNRAVSAMLEDPDIIKN